MSFNRTVFSLLVSLYIGKIFLENNLTMCSKNFKNRITFNIIILLVSHPEEKIKHTCKDMLTRMLLMWLLILCIIRNITKYGLVK